MSLLKPSQEKEEKIPGKLARTYMRLQTINAFIGAVITPIWSVYAAIKGKLHLPLGFMNIDADLNTPVKRGATVITGFLYSAYLVLNGTARLRTVKDTATRQKIALGELEPENAVFKSNGADRTLTKVEASISGLMSAGSFAYALHEVTKGQKDFTSPSVLFATVSAVTAGIMGVVKFRAANAAEKSAQEKEALQHQPAPVLPEHYNRGQMQPPAASFSKRKNAEPKPPAMASR